MPYHVFIVEDHPVMRDAYAAVLDLEPDIMVCGAVGSVEEALGVLSSVACDLVVTDYALPGQSGVDLVRHLRQTRPELPALVISGHDEPAFVQEAEAAGAAGFLSKRDLVDTLIPTIHAVLAGRRVA